MIHQIWHVTHIRNDEVIWEFEGKNSIANQGAESVLESVYRNTPTYLPSAFYVRLCNDTPQITDTLTDILNEPSGNGYSPQLVEVSTVGFPTKDIAPDGNYRLTSKTVIFTASGGQIGPITTAYLATSTDNSGVLWAYLPLAITRTILDGDSMTYQFSVEEGN